MAIQILCVNFVKPHLETNQPYKDLSSWTEKKAWRLSQVLVKRGYKIGLLIDI